jgi:hypothetical protein
MDSWPDSLPQRLLREGNSEGLGDGLIETQPDAGPPQSRQRFSATAGSLAGAMNCSGAQLDTLLTFFRTTVSGGSLPFNFPNQRGAGEILVKFAKGGQPQWSETGPDVYRVSINLVTLP